MFEQARYSRKIAIICMKAVGLLVYAHGLDASAQKKSIVDVAVANALVRR